MGDSSHLFFFGFFDSFHVLPACNETTSPPNSSTDFDQSKLQVRKHPERCLHPWDVVPKQVDSISLDVCEHKRRSS